MSDGDRQRVEIDPEGRYKINGMTDVERQALRVRDLFPDFIFEMERTRDVFQFTGIDADDPIIVVTRESLEIRLPHLEWPHPNIPFPSSRFWKRLSWKRLTDKTITTRVQEARQIRLEQYQDCEFCKRRFQPERLTMGACDDCADEHLGIIH